MNDDTGSRLTHARRPDGVGDAGTARAGRYRYALVLALAFVALAIWTFADGDVGPGVGFAGVAVLWVVWWAVRRRRGSRARP